MQTQTLHLIVTEFSKNIPVSFEFYLIHLVILEEFQVVGGGTGCLGLNAFSLAFPEQKGPNKTGNLSALVDVGLTVSLSHRPCVFVSV